MSDARAFSTPVGAWRRSTVFIALIISILSVSIGTVQFFVDLLARYSTPDSTISSDATSFDEQNGDGSGTQPDVDARAAEYLQTTFACMVGVALALQWFSMGLIAYGLLAWLDDRRSLLFYRVCLGHTTQNCIELF